MDNLQKAGLLEAVLGLDFQQKFGAKFVRGQEVCDFDFSDQYTEGWSWTWQVKRAEFDHTLAKAIEAKGVSVLYENSVEDVIFHSDGSSVTKVRSTDGNVRQVKAKHIIDGSGYGRVLPRLLNLDQPTDFPVRAAFFTHLKDNNRPIGTDGNRITIVIYNQDTWIWIIPFSDHVASVGIVGNPDDVDKFDGELTQQFGQWVREVPVLKDRFQDAEFIFEPQKVKGYSAAVKQLYGNGFTLTGNSTEFLDPVFSSGVTFATESGALAGELVARELSGSPVDWEKEYTTYINRGVDVFPHFREGLV